ncbi:MAG: hypothetical protein M1840_003236 [Geoglossum simile]|nr:MAG: hypothetical protein M1840_003236 [Geoglossum simile]
MKSTEHHDGDEAYVNNNHLLRDQLRDPAASVLANPNRIRYDDKSKAFFLLITKLSHPRKDPGRALTSLLLSVLSDLNLTKTPLVDHLCTALYGVAVEAHKSEITPALLESWRNEYPDEEYNKALAKVVGQDHLNRIFLMEKEARNSHDRYLQEQAKYLKTDEI